MFRNLSPSALGITGRQSELIELALTYGFRGFDMDMGDFAKRAGSRGLDHSRRFIDSAKLRIGEFKLPVSWRGPETTYKADLAQLPEIAELAASIGATRCFTDIMPANDESPYHENFELHRQRLSEIGETLARKEIRLGMNLLTAPIHRANLHHEFIYEVEPFLKLVDAMSSPNVGIVLDTWNWHFGQGGLDQLSELDVSRFVSVRLADAPDSVDPANVEESQRVLPGSGGLVDCAKVVSILSEKGYNGPITPSPSPSSFSGMTRDSIVQATADSMDTMYRAAGLTKSGQPVAAEVVNPVEG